MRVTFQYFSKREGLVVNKEQRLINLKCRSTNIQEMSTLGLMDIFQDLFRDIYIHSAQDWYFN